MMAKAKAKKRAKGKEALEELELQEINRRLKGVHTKVSQEDS